MAQQLSIQVGGHKPGDGSKDSHAFLALEDGTILKPLQKGKRGDSERNFYLEVERRTKSGTLRDADSTEEQFRQKRSLEVLLTLIPRFIAVRELPPEQGGVPGLKYLQLENILAKFQTPSVLDVKLGQRTYDEDATPDKIDYELKRAPFQHIVGFRITGMQVYQSASRSNVVHGKSLGRSLDDKTSQSGLAQFFMDGATLRADIVRMFLAQLRPFEEWFAKLNDTFCFYASSLLFVYGPDRDTGALRTDVRLIDFAHVYPARGCMDENNLFGVRRLMEMLAAIADGCAGTPDEHA